MKRKRRANGKAAERDKSARAQESRWDNGTVGEYASACLPLSAWLRLGWLFT